MPRQYCKWSTEAFVSNLDFGPTNVNININANANVNANVIVWSSEDEKVNWLDKTSLKGKLLLFLFSFTICYQEWGKCTQFKRSKSKVVSVGQKSDINGLCSATFVAKLKEGADQNILQKNLHKHKCNCAALHKHGHKCNCTQPIHNFNVNKNLKTRAILPCSTSSS